jgi:calcineurin-like phosphoesterase family protein
MKTWFTSDHQFGHANIIKYCDRPFNSVAHMNASMIGAWNGVVATEDTVYYLGDFAMQPFLVAEILPQLSGRKILIAGNHDRCHPKIGSPEKWLHAYIDAGFSSVHVDLRMEIAGESVLLHHFPYRAEIEPKQKYYGQRPVDAGGWLIHGHVHNRWKFSGRQINVSVENWNFEPASLETISAIIERGPQPTAVGRGSTRLLP